MNIKTIINRIWPWSAFHRLVLVHEKAMETEGRKLLAAQMSHQSYRNLVSGFQNFCQRELPEDIWHALIRKYMESWLPVPHTPYTPSDIQRIREQIDAAGFGGIQLWNPETIWKSISFESAEMKIAWDELRKKWESEV